ncbi:hypothetical protein [Arcticibacter tournemirensis]|uniref:Uncharacterized protein n=1 Tax=Arcticibacter tournemirensis TaxID=699437 RepID=A0A4Q0M326_9SPHI|nr:hypothetical protein [Arcticibacter tournemirensis]RXF67049.1 hypothetical protein EKH83_20825 [Arcticibacter tournemirensis]
MKSRVRFAPGSEPLQSGKHSLSDHALSSSRASSRKTEEARERAAVCIEERQTAFRQWGHK